MEITTRILGKWIEYMTPKERMIIGLRYRLVDGQKHTLEETGKNFELTRERIRQIEAKSLEKLRHLIIEASTPIPELLNNKK